MTEPSLSDLRPGDLMFAPIGGFVPGVVPVAAGQLLLAERRARLSWRRWRKIRHVAVVVQAGSTLPPGTVRHRSSGRYFPPGEHGDRPWRDLPMGDYDTYETGVITAPRVVEAMPAGARERDLSIAAWTADHVYVRPEYPDDGSGFPLGLTVAAAARRYVGTPYGFLTYAALAANFLIPDGHPMESRIARRITDRGEMICSQLADQALTDAGFHVFKDGRLPQDVVPAELFRRVMDMPGTRYVISGMPGWAEPAGWWR